MCALRGRMALPGGTGLGMLLFLGPTLSSGLGNTVLSGAHGIFRPACKDT